MKTRVHLLFSAAILCSVAAYAQNPVTTDSPFQIRYAANVGPGTPSDSYINITNSNASGQSICVNVYAFSPDTQMISCCSCVVAGSGLVNLGVKRDLTSNTLTPAVPSSITIKLLATTGGACNAATPGTPAVGLLAWGTTLHEGPAAGAYSVTETGFRPASLSGAELSRLSSFCGFNQANGSGYGICRSCRAGALGGVRN